MPEVQVVGNELANASASLPGAQEQHTMLVEGLASGPGSRQQAGKSDACSALCRQQQRSTCGRDSGTSQASLLWSGKTRTWCMQGQWHTRHKYPSNDGVLAASGLS
jgi:hypothetical protein